MASGRPSVTVDCVVFGLDDEGLKVLLIQRAGRPYKGRWALPGGFVEIDEPLDTAARRELAEEAGLRDVFLEQLYTFGDPGRDPRGRVITVAYFALVSLADHEIRAASDARRVAWFGLSDPPRLAFDHRRVLALAHDRLRSKVRYQPLGFELLPKRFTLSQLQQLYEMVLGRPLDKRNFRRKILRMEILVRLDETEKGVAHRAARLYRFDARKYRSLEKRGVNFEV